MNADCTASVTESNGDGHWTSMRAQLGAAGMLSIIMPAYNLGDVIVANIRQVRQFFSGHVPFEIVVVDDGSDDHTRRELASMCSVISELVPVYLRANQGKGAALREGFEASRGSYVLLLDADLDLPPEQVTRFFEIMAEEEADVVIGSKRHPESKLEYVWYRKLMSTVYFFLVKLLIGLPIRDTQTGIKLFKREVLEWVLPRMLVKRFAFDLELLAIAHRKGFKIAEAPIKLVFRSRLGCVRPVVIKQILIDTLAIFYRVRILHYYDSIRSLPSPHTSPLVSIIIAFPAFSRYLEECLAGIESQTYHNIEVILLPDEPSGRKWPERIRESPTGRIRPAEKRNQGIAEARGSIVAFLDDDTIPSENWLRHAIPYFGDEDIAAVGGPASTAPSDPFLAQLGGKVYANPLVSGCYRYRYEPGRVREVDDLPSCNLLVRSDILRTLNGFRTEYWPGEDTFLCMEIVHRLRRKILYDPQVHVYHHRRRLLGPHLRQIARYAIHRGYFARRFPATSRRFSYMLPSIFVAGLIAGIPLSFLHPWLASAYLGTLATYLVLTFASCFPWETFLMQFKLQPLVWLITWLGVILTHIVYGIRFLDGLISRSMPDTVQKIDHPSERGITL